MISCVETKPTTAQVNAGERADVVIIGNKKELKIFKANIGSLALAAETLQLTTVQDVSLLFTELDQGVVTGSSRQLLGIIAEQGTTLRRVRLEQVVQTAADGMLDSMSVLKEHQRLAEFELDAREVDQDHAWFTVDGINGRLNDNGAIEPEIYTDGFEHDTVELARITESPINAFGFQHEMTWDRHSGKPQFTNELTGHYSYGVLEDTGKYTPVVTMLSESHEVMQRIAELD
ncbi:hypothetical protein BH09PAT3_BH09PAT3_3310 [soil metagenome]